MKCDLFGERKLGRVPGMYSSKGDMQKESASSRKPFSALLFYAKNRHAPTSKVRSFGCASPVWGYMTLCAQRLTSPGAASI